MNNIDKEMFEFKIERIEWEYVLRYCMKGISIKFEKEYIEKL